VAVFARLFINSANADPATPFLAAGSILLSPPPTIAHLLISVTVESAIASAQTIAYRLLSLPPATVLELILTLQTRIGSEITCDAKTSKPSPKGGVTAGKIGSSFRFHVIKVQPLMGTLPLRAIGRDLLTKL